MFCNTMYIQYKYIHYQTEVYFGRKETNELLINYYFLYSTFYIKRYLRHFSKNYCDVSHCLEIVNEVKQ